MIILPRFLCVTIDGFGLEKGFVDHLHTTRTTSNYSAIADRHTLQITTASAKPFFSLLFLHRPLPSNVF
jgi:hypothetical protein